MEERKIEYTLRNISFYIGGFFFIGLGVVLLLRAELGAGAWDAVNYNFQAIFPNLTLGMCSFIFSFSVWTIVLLYRRERRYLLMVIPMVMVSLSIDLWDIILLGDLAPNSFLEQLGWALSGTLILPLALSLIISSNFPAFVFDELMIMFKEIFRRKTVVGVRIGIEIFAVILAIIFWFIADVELNLEEVSGADIGLGAVSYGTFIFALVLGPLIGFYLKLLKDIDDTFIKIHSKKVSIYIFGMVIIAFGVVMMIKSDIGLSSWDTLHWSLHKLTGITVGTATIVVAMTFTFFVTITNKNWKYLLMTIPILSVGTLIDLFNLYWFESYEPSTLVRQSFTFGVGLFLLPFGGALLIVSTYPAGVFDEFMLTIMRLLKTSKLMRVRVIMEITAVILAIVISLIVAEPGEPLGKFKVGTVIFTLSVGLLLKTYLKGFEKVGMFEIK